MTNQGEAVIQLFEVGVSYKRRHGFMRYSSYWALRDITLDVKQGETLGVIGRNGAGKSTLLRLLAGIIEPDKGRVIRNKGIKASLLSLQVGFNPYLTGRENVILSGMLQGMKYHEIKKCMDAILEFADIGDFIDQPVKTYSAGMRARLGFSISMQVDPDVLLIDEILGVGDAEFKRKSYDALKGRMRTGRTVVVVSHSMDMLEKLCDRVIWIRNGYAESVKDINMISEALKF